MKYTTVLLTLTAFINCYAAYLGYTQQAATTPDYGRIALNNIKSNRVSFVSGNSDHIHIVQLGDSIADGTNSPMSYYVGNNYTPSTVKYVNLAVGGYRFKDIVNNKLADAVSLNPDVVFVHCGANDIAWTYTFGSTSVQPYITAIYDAFSQRGIHIYFSEVIPRSPGTTYAAKRIAWNTALAAWVSARPYAHLIQCYSAMEDDVVSGDLEDDYDSGDGLHINSTGDQYMGGTVWYSEYAFPQP